MQKEILGVALEAIPIEKILKYVSKQFGAIHRTEAITINGDKGFLIWDYILFNEITFVISSTNQYISMFTSISDSKTEEWFNEILRKNS